MHEHSFARVTRARECTVRNRAPAITQNLPTAVPHNATQRVCCTQPRNVLARFVVRARLLSLKKLNTLKNTHERKGRR